MVIFYVFFEIYNLKEIWETIWNPFFFLLLFSGNFVDEVISGRFWENRS